MRIFIRHLTILCSVMLALVAFSSQATAQVLFSDNFEDRVADQAVIGNGWTWFLLAFDANTCTGDANFTWGPWSDGNGDDVLAANRNWHTAGGDGSYYRAGLEVPAWDGTLSNMLRVYGDQYLNYGPGCERVLIFQEMPISSSGDFTFSFDLAQAQYGAPANGEITGAFVKVIQANDPWATLWTQEVITTPPAPPTLGSQSVEFNIPAQYVGELLQFGFYNDVTENLGQGWDTSAATYDNVELAEVVVLPPPPDRFVEGVPVPLWAFISIAGLLVFVGGLKLRSRNST